MATVPGDFTYVIKHPGRKAESARLAEGVEFFDEIYRVLESAEGNPAGGKVSMGDRPYPKQFGKSHLRVIFDDEFGHKSMQPNTWGMRGPILVARLEGNHYASLRPEEIEGVIRDLDQQIRKDPNDWDQNLKDMGKYF